MRLLKRVERSFVTQLVVQTRRLISTGKPVYEKIALLQFSGARHLERAEKFRDLLEELPIRLDREERLKAVITLRERAGSYLWATAKFLRSQDKDRHSLHRMPRLFATPTWAVGKKLQEDSREIPFMEFSS